MPLSIEFQLPSYYHASWHGFFAPIYTFCRVWFLYDYNMLLGAKSQLPLYYIYAKFSSYHIIAGLLVRIWAPILLQYAIHSCFSKWLYGHVWSCVVMYYLVFSHMIMCHHVWSCGWYLVVSSCVVSIKTRGRLTNIIARSFLNPYIAFMSLLYCYICWNLDWLVLVLCLSILVGISLLWHFSCTLNEKSQCT